ncbi:hypothetical protein B0H17DRAFT_371772 [Mycena rosella]|uniref:Uncharacterized protein n=1 Tax=Mycena rosella TaxID=1033263 RepID=A0AAD7DTH1_MYCRO|nr:hypothetical protein B0H17DRAFT_371772 [Mycena rosella]
MYVYTSIQGVRSRPRATRLSAFTAFLPRHALHHMRLRVSTRHKYQDIANRRPTLDTILFPKRPVRLCARYTVRAPRRGAEYIPRASLVTTPRIRPVRARFVHAPHPTTPHPQTRPAAAPLPNCRSARLPPPPPVRIGPVVPQPHPSSILAPRAHERVYHPAVASAHHAPQASPLRRPAYHPAPRLVRHRPCSARSESWEKRVSTVERRVRLRLRLEFGSAKCTLSLAYARLA